MKRRSEILVIPDSEVSSGVVQAVEAALREVVAIAHMKIPVYSVCDEVVFERVRRTGDEKPSRPDWLFEGAHDSSCGDVRVNADKLFTLLRVSVWEEKIHPFFVLISSKYLRSDVHLYTPNWYSVTFAAALSVKSFLGAGTPSEVENNLATVAMHAAGHMFGLIPAYRVEAVIESCGVHCANVCVMRHPEKVPRDWTRLTRNRLDSKTPFCSLCLTGLREFFSS